MGHLKHTIMVTATLPMGFDFYTGRYVVTTGTDAATTFIYD